METETWIERLLIVQLTTHDRRYKHDYGGIEKTTDDLVAACTQLDAIMTEGGSEWPSLEQLLSMDAELEPEVEAALQTLQDRGLIERVGERERPGPPFEPGDYGTTAVWKPTVEGRAEARAIREAYSDDVEALADSHGEDSEEFREEIVSVARTYGIIPSYFR
ncbi:hypothetical protein AArcSl_0160 [Halalkaliarchaeum desulfuricum]|uniref:Transcriptional regulator n=1 Tax=Halalkaliarchaeum desulfuricum TaxID=2055893 RepID=A0A343TFE3_9EURY|nr:hypothetical protein [Halalkaliarchaeum desulfuricum]AUX07815.1 hypothetical protein AArcSl_0160 [Halalkaliarchaeum desulfuricum]